ncbi:hypothetical protein Bca4012_064581 [Brassica carinata]|uniref:Uncharacterized protein n=1 Tax=Brassica carinata TaxID=52824 RepID=A0A8X7VMV5_BRACI|nr:hypothetical protein Bca52824_017070 [Brassica carinata]
MREAFSIPPRLGPSRERSPVHKQEPIKSYRREESKEYRRIPNGSGRSDLRDSLMERRGSQSKNVWNRLDKPYTSSYPRNRKRYHPYQNLKEQDPKERFDFRSKARRNLPLTHSESHTSSRRQASPDSQRTIWAPLAAHRGERHPRETSRHSPKRYSTEWRPVSQHRQDGDTRSEVSNSMRAETEEERIKNLKGKAIALDSPPGLVRSSSNKGTLVIRDQDKGLTDGNGRTIEDQGVKEKTPIHLGRIYTDPNPVGDEEMIDDVDDIDDLLEKEREMEEKRKEKEKLLLPHNQKQPDPETIQASAEFGSQDKERTAGINGDSVQPKDALLKEKLPRSGLLKISGIGGK